MWILQAHPASSMDHSDLKLEVVMELQVPSSLEVQSVQIRWLFHPENLL